MGFGTLPDIDLFRGGGARGSDQRTQPNKGTQAAAESLHWRIGFCGIV